MTSLVTTWSRLAVDGEASAGFVRLRLPDVKACAVYAAKSLPAELEAVLLEVDTESIPPKVEYPDARGLSVHGQVIVPGRGGRTRIVLSLSDARYRDVFRALAEDVVSSLLDASAEPEVVRRFVSRLSRWQAFLRRHGGQGLSLEERRGLLGELLLIRSHLLENCDHQTAIAAWRGCRGANHDFQFSRGSIEVKTTSSNTPHAFHVSNIKQLDSPGQGQLFVYFVVVEEGEGGDTSLPELIDSLRGLLDTAAGEALEDCLLDAGYLEGQRETYNSPRYSLRRQRFFRSEDTFPRLREAILPDGVEDVRYQVAVAACAPFEVEPDEVLELVVRPVGVE